MCILMDNENILPAVLSPVIPTLSPWTTPTLLTNTTTPEKWSLLEWVRMHTKLNPDRTCITTIILSEDGLMRHPRVIGDGKTRNSTAHLLLRSRRRSPRRDREWCNTSMGGRCDYYLFDMCNLSRRTMSLKREGLPFFWKDKYGKNGTKQTTPRPLTP